MNGSIKAEELEAEELEAEELEAEELEAEEQETKELTADELAKLIPMEGSFLTAAEPSTSLESLIVKASNLLLFEATSDDKGGIIRMKFKSSGSYNLLDINPDLSEAGIPISRSGTELIFDCKSLAHVEAVLHRMQSKQVVNRKMDEAKRQDILDVLLHPVASAIVMVLTFRGKIRVCGQFIRWSKPEFRRKDAFEVNMPLTFSPGIDVDISSVIGHLNSSEERVPRLSIKIDDDVRLNLYRPVLVSVSFDHYSAEAICGGEDKIHYLPNNRIDELNSKWNVSYASGPDPAKYWNLDNSWCLH